MTPKSAQHKAILHKDSTRKRKTESLVVEKPLQIVLNGREFSMTMQTPGDEAYLIRGLLHAEGIEHSKLTAFALKETPRATIAQVRVDCKKELYTHRSIASTSSCGLCGKESFLQLFDGLTEVTKPIQIKASTIQQVYQDIGAYQTLFHETGGCHAASAATKDGEILCVFEDIGRHNAVDKVVGWLLDNDQAERAAILTVSGRISYEIIQKCIRIQIPILTAISAPSALAVEIAEEYGVTLAAFCREDRTTFYSHEHRIIANEKMDVQHVR